ncbi:hypothetical protein [uncultured Roseibium sp.]|uniref:hypothetical protein n=1 Tax=uncultured Roseibium sp. TaxID=1936171 RepID=UPI00321713B2
MSEELDRDVSLTVSSPVAEAILKAAIHRALNVVEAETRALRDGGGTDLKSFEYRKSQALLDLSRARQTVSSTGLGQEIRDLLENLRLALKDNLLLLSRHLAAVKEIADLVAQNMLDADSDGTYARPFPEYLHD